mmetsp:Transcript_33743/g.106106  ORF Transcript_33743/g.106106 Transcript_33743/m.106106 type:complete len:88 (-) Transcript_33743:226-489(-)
MPAPEKGWRSSKRGRVGERPPLPTSLLNGACLSLFRHARWFSTFEPEPQEAEMKACYERITQELRAASRRRVEMEEEIRQLRAEPAD